MQFKNNVKIVKRSKKYQRMLLFVSSAGRARLFDWLTAAGKPSTGQNKPTQAVTYKQWAGSVLLEVIMKSKDHLSI